MAGIEIMLHIEMAKVKFVNFCCTTGIAFRKQQRPVEVFFSNNGCHPKVMDILFFIFQHTQLLNTKNKTDKDSLSWI